MDGMMMFGGDAAQQKAASDQMQAAVNGQHQRVLVDLISRIAELEKRVAELEKGHPPDSDS